MLTCSMTDDKEEYVAFPFLQDIVKDRLRDYYNAIAMATENARSIIDCEPFKIMKFYGNDFPRNGLINFRKWIIFNNQD